MLLVIRFLRGLCHQLNKLMTSKDEYRRTDNIQLLSDGTAKRIEQDITPVDCDFLSKKANHYEVKKSAIQSPVGSHFLLTTIHTSE